MPKKICNTPACNELVSMNERYCTVHKIVYKKDKKEINKKYDEKYRNKKHNKFYHSKGWKNTRLLVLKSYGGLCLRCSKNDLTVKADMVDHIIPLTKDWEQRLNRNNLQPLCYICHNKKTADDVKLYGGRV
ncbi:MAG: HNH endonuclease signature motif containing protein [Sulfurimonas sp.]